MSADRASLTLRTKISAAFGLAVLLILLIAIASRDAMIAALDADAWIDHTYAVLTDLHDIRAQLMHMETGVRGFALTGNEAYLRRYHEDQTAILANIAAFRSLTHDNAAQQQRVQRLVPLINRKFDEMNRIIGARQHAGVLAARAQLETGAAKRAMDKVERVTAAMQQEERRLLAERERRASTSVHQAMMVLVYGLPIASVVLILIAYLIINHLVGPLHRLTALARRIAMGDLSVGLPQSSRKDEIGALKASFAAMITALREHGRARNDAEARLRLLNRDLEGVISQRTQDLSRANEKLRAEIEARVHAERALHDEHERLQTTLRSIGDGVIATDRDGRVALLNKAAETMTGWSEVEAKGRPFSEVFHIVHEETRVERESPVADALRRGRTVELANHTVLIAKDGSERVIADSAAPIWHSEGTMMGAVLVFRDMTDKVRLEQRLMRHQKLESLGTLAGGIAHDFNNLLTAILGNISLARISSEDVNVLLSEAEGACVRARDLTQQLLTFSKGGAPIKRLAYLKNLVRDSAVFALRGSRVLCEFEIDEDLWPAEIDAGQINQSLHNIIINAKEAMPDGGKVLIDAHNVTLRDGAHHSLTGDYVRITIADEGPGIPAAVMDRIFEPYFSTKHRGSGLGLASAYSIVRQHDGYIEIESPSDAGTRVSLYLPALSSHAMDDALEDGAASGKLLSGVGRIIVMDDDETIRRFAATVLRRCGYDVSTAETGEKAIELVAAAHRDGRPYSVAILDLTVPGGMGGLACLKELRRIDLRIKAIASSGYATDPIMSCPEQYGFDAVLAKPYQVELLSEMVAAAIVQRGNADL